ncbi:YihY/virulence factor BrkB family protein [Tissierella sp. MSJ-40]|uniref:YihY/virulence factor BrkB family protein n=1 Tax=Tissierella simiarum TaxID=2841534 RepID=A0ABS6E1G1_9FIRM|nr:YihY/virulence factor BrkB family protein [Tissierella simiarum]MBU5436639.1 YihY/virulence factor BrkB family protein [Tissierella simiarum]
MKFRNLDKYYNKKWILFIDQLLFRFKDDAVTAIGAQLTYYLILSIFPFLIFFLNILSFTPIAREDIFGGLIIVLPIETQKILSGIITEIVQSSSETLLSLGAITGIWAASKGIMAVIRAINRAYDFEESRSYWKLRGLSIIFTIALLILLTLVFLTLVFGELLGNKVFAFIGKTETFITIWRYFRVTISLFSMILIFALLYKFSPSTKKERRIKFKNTLPGAIFASIGWIIISTIFSYYVNNFGNFSKTYGSLGGIIILLIWLYISSIIIVLGGEINATLESFKEDGFVTYSKDSFLNRHKYRKKP